MGDFDLIEQFIAAGLHETVLRGEGDNQLGYSRTGWWRKRQVPDAPVEVADDGSEVRCIEALDWLPPRDIENELLRQMREWLGKCKAEVRHGACGFYAVCGQEILTDKGWAIDVPGVETTERSVLFFGTYPEALLAACVAVTEDAG